MGLTSVFCFIVAGVSYLTYTSYWKEKGVKRWDIAAFFLGGLLFVLYWICKNNTWGPLATATLAAAADLILYFPILRETFHEPHKECATAYGLNSMKFIPSFFAMGSYSAATYLYPMALVFANAFVVVWLISRRRSLAIHTAPSLIIRSSHPS